MHDMANSKARSHPRSRNPQQPDPWADAFRQDAVGGVPGEGTEKVHMRHHPPSPTNTAFVPGEYSVHSVEQSSRDVGFSSRCFEFLLCCCGGGARVGKQSSFDDDLENNLDEEGAFKKEVVQNHSHGRTTQKVLRIS